MMRILLTCILVLVASCAEARSYKPKGYVTDVAAYYPTLMQEKEIKEIEELSEMYGRIRPTARGSMRRRVDMIMAQGITNEERIRLFNIELRRARVILNDTLPQDAMDVIEGYRSMYEQMSPQAKHRLVEWNLVGDNRLMQDTEIAKYIAAHQATTSK